MIEFRPKPASNERLVAGVVALGEDGGLHYECAADPRKLQQAFGAIGASFFDVSDRLCRSLAQHWLGGRDAETWAPPFAGATITHLDTFSAADLVSACTQMLDRVSTIHTLMDAYEMQATQRKTSIVDRVRAAVKRDANAKHLARRFNRQLNIGGQDQGLRVDFLGQRYACYFLQVTVSERGLEANTERALARLYELQAIRRLMKEPAHPLDLLEDERPEVFELLMVGQRANAVQRRAIYLIEALADKSEVVARVEESALSAAERVSHQERLAA